jgi:hypothetical protein
VKLLKFDTFYPVSYIESKIAGSSKEIQKMSFLEFHNWLVMLRMNYSDYYTYNLTLSGWEAKDIFLDNKTYKGKCEKHYFGYSVYIYKIINRIKNLFCEEKRSFKEKLIKKIIQVENPDVIFVREHSTIRSKFWEHFKNNILVVSRMDCNIPPDWSPLSFDLIYTNIPYYIDFFRCNLIPTNSNSNGFDERLLNEIKLKKKDYDVIYVGGLGDKLFTERTRFFENLALKSNGVFSFKWWGFKMGDFDANYPELAKTYMGVTGGIDMFTVYSQSKVILNYYESGLTKNSYNQRIFEVIGIGSLLIARDSETFIDWKNYLVTYSELTDCLEKIKFYLENDLERERIAKCGQQFIIENYSYRKLMKIMSDELVSAYNQKFGTSGYPQAGKQQ